MNIDWGVLVEKAPEIAIVLVVVWFTLKMLAGMKSFIEARDKIFFNQLEAILAKRNLTMMPQIVHRGLDTIAQIIFLPKGPQTIQTSPLQIPRQSDEEKPTE